MQIEYERYMELFLMLSMAIKENNTRFPSRSHSRSMYERRKNENI